MKDLGLPYFSFFCALAWLVEEARKQHYVNPHALARRPAELLHLVIIPHGIRACVDEYSQHFPDGADRTPLSYF